MRSGWLSGIRITSHHNIKGQMMTSDMQCGDVRFAESPMREENILFDLGMVLGLSENAAPHLS